MARVKAKDHEKLSDSNIRHVISLMESDKPITKKAACEILNISYNTVRLNNIIEGYKTRTEHERVQKEKRKGKPATEDEVATVIKGYLEGSNVSDISKSIYRSPSFVRGIIDRMGVPQKQIGAKGKPVLLPDQCFSLDFYEGQVAWSAFHNAPCEVISEVADSEAVNYKEKYGCKVYKIYVFEALDEVPEFYPNVSVGGFYAYLPAYELGSLEHLRKYNVTINP